MESARTPDTDTEFERHRGLLQALAYRMVGTVADAEDLVQDAWLRWVQADRGRVESPKDYLCATVTRLAIDHLRSARVRRETYVGAWLPEPIVAPLAEDPLDSIVLARSLSMAFLMMLERLAPMERAVLLLHDVFGFEYAEVARIVERNEPACRQIAKRARDRVADRPRFDASQEEAEAVALAFSEAAATGDVDALLRLIAPDAIFWTDSGGKVRAARNPIFGADRITRFLAGLARKHPPAQVEMVRVNGGPGLVLRRDDGRRSVLAFAIDDRRIQAIYMIANPDKLERLPSS